MSTRELEVLERAGGEGALSTNSGKEECELDISGRFINFSG